MNKITIDEYLTEKISKIKKQLEKTGL